MVNWHAFLLIKFFYSSLKRALHRVGVYFYLFLGIVSPINAFSRQDEPKRVTVVVKAKEINTAKQLLQVPADNLPKTIHGPAVKKIGLPVEKVIAKTSVSTDRSTDIEKPGEKPVKKGERPMRQHAAAKNVLTDSKTTVTGDNSANQQFNSSTNTAANPVKPNSSDSISPADDISISKTVQQVGEKTITTIKAKKDNKELATFTHSSKVNSISYIWIGCFLIIAGIVLGLLFGKPAFLISFVGVVFITLGLVI
jgi:hypothetical protein